MAELVTCLKCGGSGYLNWCRQVDNGKCFDCNGTGKVKAGKINTREEEYVFPTAYIGEDEKGHYVGVDSYIKHDYIHKFRTHDRHKIHKLYVNVVRALNSTKGLDLAYWVRVS